MKTAHRRVAIDPLERKLNYVFSTSLTEKPSFASGISRTRWGFNSAARFPIMGLGVRTKP